MKRLLLLPALLCVSASAQTSTTWTGTIKDLSGNVVTSGQVTFTLTAGRDTTISGTARFVPSTITCSIVNGSLTGNGGTGSCVTTMNTALSPSGTGYTVCVQPNFITPGSCFGTYAVQATQDISTAAPSPSQVPINYGLPLIATTGVITDATGSLPASRTTGFATVATSGVITDTTGTLPVSRLASNPLMHLTFYYNNVSVTLPSMGLYAAMNPTAAPITVTLPLTSSDPGGVIVIYNQGTQSLTIASSGSDNPPPTTSLAAHTVTRLLSGGNGFWYTW